MLKLRLLPSSHEKSVNVGFTSSPSHDANSSLSFLDLSREEPGNQILIADRLISSGSIIPTDDVLVSNVSVVRRDRTNPTPLYYQYDLGRGKFVVVLRDVLPGDVTAAHRRLMSSLRFVLENGQLATINWWVGRPVWSDPGWLVRIYVDRINDEENIVWVQYDGWDVLNNVPARGVKEVINAVPIPTTEVISLVNQSGFGVLGYQISSTNVDDYAPAIALFPNVSPCPSVSITSSLLQILDSPVISIQIGPGIPIRNVVDQINRSTTKIHATVLNDSFQSELVTGSYLLDNEVNGVVIRYDSRLKIRFNSSSRIAAYHPYPAQPSEPWYPRIRNGIVVQDWRVVRSDDTFVDTGRVQFTISEFDEQAWSSIHGMPYKDIAGEVPFFINPTTIRTRRSPIRSYDSLTIFQFGIEADIIRDIDLETGTIFLNSRVERREDLSIDYTYLERFYEYNGINLNVLPGHNQDLLGKYIGLFLTPSIAKVGSNDAELFQVRNVYHVIGDSYEDVLDRINNFTFYSLTPHGVLRVQTFILGVFRVTQSRDVREAASIVDSRRYGGGFDLHSIDFRLAPEARMVADRSYWDGESFPIGSVLVADLPDIARKSITGYPDYVDATTGTVWANPTGRLLEEEIKNFLHRYPAAGTIVLHEYDLEYPG